MTEYHDRNGGNGGNSVGRHGPGPGPERLAGVERQPAGEVADQLTDDAFDQGDPCQRNRDRSDQALTTVG